MIGKKYLIKIFILSGLLLMAQPFAGQKAQAHDSPPLRSLLKLELKEEQLNTIKMMVQETETVRHRLTDDYSDLCTRIQQEERARSRNEKKIRDLKRRQVVNRDELRIEKERFHRLVESQLTTEQKRQWQKLRNQTQKWCQDKWMRCGNCTCGKRSTKTKNPSPDQ